MSQVYDVLILGGGPAGLSMATTLARQAYTALVVDSGIYRNARATHMHNVPGFDHVPPAEFRAKVRSDLAARYKSIEFRDATTIVKVRQRFSTTAETGNNGGGYGNVSSSVTQIKFNDVDNMAQNTSSAVDDADELADARFEARDSNGNIFYGRKLGIATGVRDKLEEQQVDGYAECWGRGIFHCLFCDGFEERDAPSVGVLGTGLLSSAPMLAHVALLAKRLSAHTTIYTNANASLTASLPAFFHSTSITIEARKIMKLALKDYPSETTVVVTFEDGETKEEAFLASHPWLEQAAPFAKQLGLEVKEEAGGELIVIKNPAGETSLEGCFAAGDAVVAMKSVVQAVQTGQVAGAGVVMQVMKELDAKDEI